KLSYGHLSIVGLLWIAGHFLMLRQLPVFMLPSSGNTTSRGSRSKESTVLSSNIIVITVRSGSTSTASRVLPLTSGKRRSLERRLVERVVLRSAIFRLSSEGDLWLGLRTC